MACDLKMEIFSHKVFHKLWYQMGEIEIVPDILEVYGDECVADDTYIEECDDMFLKVLHWRDEFISNEYTPSVSTEEITKIKTLSELYDYVIRMCDRDDLFGNQTVFERMLATSDFVAHLCYIKNMETDSLIDALRVGHILWSMYFDKFTAEFYEKGGWSQLKRELKYYELLSECNTIYYGPSVFYLQAIKEAIVNLCHFKNAISYEEQKQHPFHISVLWIQFRIENFESYINIPLSYETSTTDYELHLLLDNLKLIFDFIRCNPGMMEKHESSSVSTEMSYSEIHPTLGEGKGTQDDKAQIQYSGFEREIESIEEVSDKFSHTSTNVFKESQIRCQTTSTEEPDFNIIGPKENLGLVDNTCTEMEQMRQTSRIDNQYSHNENILIGMQSPSGTSIKNLSNIPDYDLNYKCKSKSHMSETEGDTIDCFYEGNVDKCDKIINTDEVLILQVEETKSQKVSSPKNEAYYGDLSSINEIVNDANKIENSKEVVEKRACSEKGRIPTVKSINNSFSSKKTALERNGRIISKDLPTLNDLSSINENANIEERIRRIRKARAELRNEQRDPEVKNFLRMLLVLGDMEGTEFVLSTLHNIEDCSKNAHESSNKQKKKLKTKGMKFEPSTLKTNKEYPEKSQESVNLQKKRSKKKKSKK